MASFGWVAGVDYSPHISDNDNAAFSCLLGMPWASTNDHWDSAAVPEINQQNCETGFGEWLSPWADEKVGWQLFAQNNAGNWTSVGTERAIVPILDATKTGLLRPRARERLHRHVTGHVNAMGFMQGGSGGKSLTYPIMSPGLAQLPAPLSDSLFGTTAVLEVNRTDIKGFLVAAVPVFKFGGQVYAPNGKAMLVPRPETDKGPPRYEFAYDGPKKTVDGIVYTFSGCLVQCVEAGHHEQASVTFDPAPVTVRSRVPNRQLYAEVSRRFWPLKLWLDSTNVGDGDAAGFCQTFVRLLGCGEDELLQGVVVGSIYEFVLEHAAYTSVFPVAHQDDYKKNAAEMLDTFNQHLGQQAFVGEVLKAFARRLRELGLEDDAKCADELTSKAATNNLPVSVDELAAANHLQEVLGRQGRGAHPIWSAWLAAMLPRLAKVGNPTAVADGLIERSRKAMGAADPSGDPVVDDDVLRIMNGQIDYADAFWENLHEQEDVAAELVRQESSYVRAIAKRLSNVAQIDLHDSYDAGRKAIEEMQDPSAPQAEDPPLQLRYSPAQKPDREIRGCILALRAGVPRDDETVDWTGKPEWITTFNVRPAEADGFGASPLMNVDGRVALFVDTQGATRSDGLSEQASPYSGTPLFAAPPAPNRGNETALPEMFERIPTGSEVPRLAYSAYYRAVRGTVDNAGVILESELWMQPESGERPLPGLPRAASDIADKYWGAGEFRYLSRQPPSLPTYVGADDCGVKEETLSFVAHQGDRDDFRVAVLFGGDGYVDVDDKREQEIKLYAPTASPGFVQRWLAADLLVPKAKRWAPVQALADDEIKSLIPTDSQIMADKAGKYAIPHPAVSALELRVRWLSATDAPFGTPVTRLWTLSHLSGKDWQRGLLSQLTVRRVDDTTPHACVFEPVEKGGYRIDVPKGTRAVVQAVSVIPGGFVDGPFARFERSALVYNPALQNERPYEAHGSDYCSRRAATVCVESLPDAPREGAFDFRDAEFELKCPQTVAQRQEMVLRLIAKNHGAAWVRGGRLELKRWQWSGYPVEFPTGTQLKDWLSLYAGTTDTMPELPPAMFSTILQPVQKEKPDKNWLLEQLVMEPVKLATPRPASHMGIVVTPIPRFESLLTATVRDWAKPVFVYTRVEGVSSRKRLAPPVWQEAIPLPHTSILDRGAKQQVKQVSPGNLLVLRDPLYDTADTGAFGGIAERLELDVVSTWIEGLEEIGPNPLFHASPSRDVARVDPQPRLVLDMPFGLGYDRVVGGRPAQTGAVVRPIGSGGRWILAKCRMRRLVVPESVLDSLLGDSEGWLESRRVEDGWIPEDFAAYTETPLQRIELGAYEVKLPDNVAAPGQGERLVYLVTWHRDRWGEAEITWRPLVHVYLRPASTERWELKRHRAPYSQAKYLPSQSGGAGVRFKLNEKAKTYRVDASDYTDSRWLSFIGSFEEEDVKPAEGFEVRRKGENYEFTVADKTGTLPKLYAANNVCPSLLLIFAPQRDLMRGRIGQDGGELVGVYATSKLSDPQRVLFDRAILKAEAPDTDPKTKQQAVVMKLQRRNLRGPQEALPTTWLELVDAMFPREERFRDTSLKEGERSNEARMRLLPEYIGPINVT